MPHFDASDARSFGWPYPPTDIVPFSFRGRDFPGGVSRRLVPVFTEALSRICATPGFQLHPPPATVAGTWGYEDRQTVSGSGLSFHATGNAIDINAPWNGYGSSVPEATPFRLPPNTSELVEPLGLLWGGGPRWGSHRDWMHLENHNSPDELQPALPQHPAAGSIPLPPGHFYGPASAGQGSVHGGTAVRTPDMGWIERIQRRVSVLADGSYGPNTMRAVARWQLSRGLPADGLVGPVTWSRMFPS